MATFWAKNCGGKVAKDILMNNKMYQRSFIWLKTQVRGEEIK